MIVVKNTAILGLLLACTACSTIPFKPTELVPTRPAVVAELVQREWTAAPALFLVRQSALFEFEGMRLPMTGVMKLDAGKRSARVVGMNDMGVKLFELTVAPQASETHFTLPDLARFPRFAEAVAESVRRMFLVPAPGTADLLTVEPDRYRLSREQDGKKIGFVFGGRDLNLLEKSVTAPDEQWHVRYYEHARQGKWLIPGGIILDDEKAGYRLTLWLDNVEQVDE